MFHVGPLVLSLPLITLSPYLPDHKFADSISYDSLIPQQERFKDTLHYNTMSMEELIKLNNNQIIQQLYKSLEK